MDYRYYRGDGIELPPFIVKRLYLLRYIGFLMIAFPFILALLLMFHVLELRLIWFFVGILSGTFGNVFFVLGLTYDTYIDREGHTLVRWQHRLLGKRHPSKEFKPGRKMIYDLDESLQDPEEDP